MSETGNEFLNKISEDVDELLRNDVNRNVIQQEPEAIDEYQSLEQSLECLSLSIQNRLKVETEQPMPFNNYSLFHQLSKYEQFMEQIAKQPSNST